jgi:hypothetical protein
MKGNSPKKDQMFALCVVKISFITMEKGKILFFFFFFFGGGIVKIKLLCLSHFLLREARNESGIL